MSRRIGFVQAALLAALLVAGCGAPRATPTPVPNMPNPASVFCGQHGGHLDLRQEAAGGVRGVCVFPDRSECDEWAYFRGECRPGDSLQTPSPATAATEAATEVGPTGVSSLPNPAAVYCHQQGGRLDERQEAAGTRGVCVFPDGSECDEWAYFRGECRPGSGPGATPAVASDGWRVYRNDQLGYTFHYPAQASVSLADDPQKSVTIAGPAAAEGWPTIYISHPTDRAEFQPPEGADLAGWLTEHNLLQTGGPAASAEVRQPDTTIAGQLAIHTRLARSPQTYAYDKYFFARARQLYVIVLLHVGDQEDWSVYQHFLGSFQFEPA